MERDEVVQGVATLLAEVPKDQVEAVLNEAKLRLGLATPSVPVSGRKTSVLSLVGTIAVPALTETWNALDRFKKDISDEARVKIYDVRSNFTSWFGKMVVGAHVGSTLGYHTLTKRMFDKDIIAELGGEANVEVTLAEVWWLMEQQKNGGSGALLNNGDANIFYVRDCDRVLRALHVYWPDVGWGVLASEIGIDRWYESWRVFSRNSM